MRKQTFALHQLTDSYQSGMRQFLSLTVTNSCSHFLDIFLDSYDICMETIL